MFIIASKVTHSKEIPEDIVQEVFVTFWERRINIEEIQSLKAYLTTSARNACIQYIERHINRYDFIVSLPDVLEYVLADSNVMDKIYMKEIEQSIACSVDQMPKKMRQVFEMSRFDQKTHKEMRL